MTTFDKREQAFENKFFYDEEMKFCVVSRRRKFLGLWAAEQMHKDEEGSLGYALDIVRIGIEDNTEGALINKILKDMQDAGLEITEEELREKMTHFNYVAEEQVRKQFKTGS